MSNIEKADKKYISPELTLIDFSYDDVIATSGGFVCVADTSCTEHVLCTHDVS